MSFKNITFILHKPQLSENIGACARALKNFNFNNLSIVNPKPSFPNDKIIATSVGAKDIIKKAKVYENLETSLSNLDILVATSARFRNKNIKHISLTDLNKINYKKKVGFLFGSEASGLSNNEVSYADYTLQIPSNKNFRSLNLSHSLIIVAQIVSGLISNKKFTFEKSKKIKSATNTVGKNINKAPVEMAASLVTNLAKGITGDQINTGDIFGGVSGVIRNPNVEVLFQKMNLRTFDLTFKLVPYNQDEAYAIQKIVRTFRKCMLPSFSLGGSPVLGFGESDTKDVNENRALEASFIKVPKVCQVTYMRGSKQHPHLPAYKMCAITDVAVNYTPDGNYAVYNDGMPVATELKVSFMETKLLFSEDVDIYWQGNETMNSTA